MSFSPTDLSNLLAWYKANAGVTGTTTVTAWADQSGNSRTLTATSGAEPALLTGVINSLPVISAYTKSAKLSTSGNFPDLSAGGTIWFVGRQKATGAVTSGDAGGIWLGAGSTVNAQLRRGDTAGSGWDSIRGGINTDDTNSPETTTHITEDTFYTVRLRYNGTNNYLSINNGTEIVLASSGGGYVATPLTIFKSLSGPYGNKQFAEILVYSGNKTGNDSLEVEYYLNQKYNHFTWSGSLPTSTSTTMATNEIQGDLVGLFISTNLTTPDYKEVVCGENVGIDGSRDVTKKKTKCGVIKGFGPADWSITGSGTHNSAPGTGKTSGNDMAAIFQNETPILVKAVYATDSSLYYRQGQGQLTKYTEGANTGDPLSFDFTIDVSGTLDLTA